MLNEAEELRNKMRNEVDVIRAEREAKHRRHEILQVASRIAGSLAILPTASISGVADAALKLAVLIVDGADDV